MPVLTRKQYLGVAKETTWGTGVVPAKYLPVNTVKPEDVLSHVKDEAKRANITKTFDVMWTTKHATVDIDTNFYPDVLGYFLLGVMGKDTVTGTTTLTHVFAADPTPRSLTLAHFDGFEERQYAGCVVDEVSIKGDAEGIVSCSAKVKGKAGTVVTPSTATFSSALPLVGSGASLTVDASPNTKLFGWDVSIKRDTKLIFGASASQDPTKAVQAGLAITGKLTFDVEDASEYNMYTGQSTHVIVLTLGGSANNSALITITSAHITKASREMGNDALRVDWEFEGMYNVTDAGPGTVTLVNTLAMY